LGFLFVLFWYFHSASHLAAQSNLKLIIILPQPLSCRDYR
jgi:hypothetical protein